MDSEQLMILIVDDDSLSRRLLKAIAGKGHTYIEAGDGESGLDMINKNSGTGLIFLDLDMPIMDGYEFIKHYTENSPDSSTKLVITSCNSEAIFRANTRKNGIDTRLVSGYIQKPFSLDVLKYWVAEAQQQTGGEDNLDMRTHG